MLAFVSSTNVFSARILSILFVLSLGIIPKSDVKLVFSAFPLIKISLLARKAYSINTYDVLAVRCFSNIQGYRFLFKRRPLLAPRA